MGYLEWGKDMHAFLWQAERDIIFNTVHHSETFLHPFILLPLCGQLILLFTVFQKVPGRTLTYIGLSCLCLIMLMILVVGLMSLNTRIALSAVPFLVTGVLVLRYNRKLRQKK